jgi:hypothetical protein
MILALFIVFIASPAYIIGAIYKTNFVIKLSESEDGSFGSLVFSQIAPNMIVMINFFVVPMAIDTVSYKLINKRKTDRHESNLVKHFIFNLIATCIMPMYGQSSFLALWKLFTASSQEEITHQSMLNS